MAVKLYIEGMVPETAQDVFFDDDGEACLLTRLGMEWAKVLQQFGNDELDVEPQAAAEMRILIRDTELPLTKNRDQFAAKKEELLAFLQRAVELQKVVLVAV